MDTPTRKLHDALPWTLLYADDVALSENADALQNKLSQWAKVLKTNDLRISIQKTEHVTYAFNDSEQIPKFPIEAEAIPTSESFKYLGSNVSGDCSLDREVTNRVQVSWHSWRAMSGVLCDKNMPIKCQGKVYKAEVRPAMAYASEWWPLSTKQEQRIHVAEMIMLR
ncbi:uncharacterized protein LOC128863700 [Anastrepha ludens]|uniref:uncharacterized protein LOC128863700 n=1 Tax=Anastrepha ludens TaxID=28586 RepID=UPI0023B1951E|nr:uncharacterized protein LOC128863700 [Anastrepha ludens]